MKKNVASQKIGAQMVDATTGAAFTSAVTVYVTLDAGAQAVGSVGAGACTHEGNGYHTYAPAQAETNGDLAAFTFIGTGAVPATVQVFTSFPQTGDAFDRLGAPAGASVSADVAAVKVDTAAILVDTGTTLDARIPAALVSGRMDVSVGAMAANVLTATAINADAITAAKVAADVSAEIADAVWDEAIAGHAGAGSTGEALSAAGGAGDPWITALPGAYGAGSAGQIVGDYINAAISSRASATDLATVAGYLDTEIAAIKAKTDNLPASPAAVGDIPTATQNADALLNRDMSAVSDTNARSPLNALRFLRNKWDISGTALTVKKEDDATTAWSATVTAAPGADPVSGSDPS